MGTKPEAGFGGAPAADSPLLAVGVAPQLVADNVDGPTPPSELPLAADLNENELSSSPVFLSTLPRDRPLRSRGASPFSRRASSARAADLLLAFVMRAKSAQCGAT